jgi:thymidine kinase
MYNHPSIEIIFGPMFSGKTTEIIRKLSIYNSIGFKVLYVNTSIDTRTNTNLSTHNSTMTKTLPFDSIKVEKLEDIKHDSYDVIAIDESHFFSNLKRSVLDLVENHGKIVIVGGLTGDSNREKFGEINDLIPYADFINKLNSICLSCKKSGKIESAHFSKRISSNTNRVLIGGNTEYIPVCRACYINYV